MNEHKLEPWQKQFDARFFNPYIPSPSELKIFIAKLLADQNTTTAKILNDVQAKEQFEKTIETALLKLRSHLASASIVEK